MHYNCPALHSVSILQSEAPSDLSDPQAGPAEFQQHRSLRSGGLWSAWSAGLGAKKKKRAVLCVIAGYLGKRLGPKLAWLGRIIGSLAFNVMRQGTSKAALVSKSICAPFGSSGMVLEEAKSARHRVLRI